MSETGSIEGEVQVPNVVLNGTIIGDIHARERIVLGATARVEGNVHYGIIEMTLGAQIRGSWSGSCRAAGAAPQAPPELSLLRM